MYISIFWIRTTHYTVFIIESAAYRTMDAVPKKHVFKIFYIQKIFSKCLFASDSSWWQINLKHLHFNDYIAIIVFCFVNIREYIFIGIQNVVMKYSMSPNDFNNIETEYSCSPVYIMLIKLSWFFFSQWSS